MQWDVSQNDASGGSISTCTLRLGTLHRTQLPCCEEPQAAMWRGSHKENQGPQPTPQPAFNQEAVPILRHMSEVILDLLALHLILHEARELSGQKLCLLLATKFWGSGLHGISKTKVNPKSGVGPFFRLCNLSVMTQKWSSNQSVFIYKTWVLSTTTSQVMRVSGYKRTLQTPESSNISVGTDIKGNRCQGLLLFSFHFSL